MCATAAKAAVAWWMKSNTPVFLGYKRAGPRLWSAHAWLSAHAQASGLPEPSCDGAQLVGGPRVPTVGATRAYSEVRPSLPGSTKYYARTGVSSRGRVRLQHRPRNIGRALGGGRGELQRTHCEGAAEALHMAARKKAKKEAPELDAGFVQAVVPLVGSQEVHGAIVRAFSVLMPSPPAPPARPWRPCIVRNHGGCSWRQAVGLSFLFVERMAQAKDAGAFLRKYRELHQADLVKLLGGWSTSTIVYESTRRVAAFLARVVTRPVSSGGRYSVFFLAGLADTDGCQLRRVCWSSSSSISCTTRLGTLRKHCYLLPKMAWLSTCSSQRSSTDAGAPSTHDSSPLLTHNTQIHTYNPLIDNRGQIPTSTTLSIAGHTGASSNGL